MEKEIMVISCRTLMQYDCLIKKLTNFNFNWNEVIIGLILLESLIQKCKVSSKIMIHVYNKEFLVNPSRHLVFFF